MSSGRDVGGPLRDLGSPVAVGFTYLTAPIKQATGKLEDSVHCHDRISRDYTRDPVSISIMAHLATLTVLAYGAGTAGFPCKD